MILHSETNAVWCLIYLQIQAEVWKQVLELKLPINIVKENLKYYPYEFKCMKRKKTHKTASHDFILVER